MVAVMAAEVAPADAQVAAAEAALTAKVEVAAAEAAAVAEEAERGVAVDRAAAEVTAVVEVAAKWRAGLEMRSCRR